MTKELVFITIHGMGETEKEYYLGLKQALEKQLGEEIWSKVHFEPIYYQTALQHYQHSVWENMRHSTPLAWQDLRKFMLFGFSDVSTLEHRATDDGSVYKKIQKIIIYSLQVARKELETNNIPIVIVAHSLGCQVISNYLWDAQNNKGIWQTGSLDYPDFKSEQEDFLKLKSLKYLFTTGCNIPLFVAGFADIKAIPKPNADFKWLNYYDKDDVLGWPLKPLSPSYDLVVEQDIEIDSGNIWQSWNPQSHDGYWTDEEFINPLSQVIHSLIN
ncbi:hypothetical protein [Calothrix sp. PCC 7507]|uniref:hypothetical protein n=1 Tax=Calothrix sp. PCC 7507 TaxID=99598 RepID=UPI00029F2820|nr:hypothetical protein [Calothrix sp. PCC 7507]AFY32629.1 hypothetical protein Cal7507_2190 [Calothrix sp. PCC 7507]